MAYFWPVRFHREGIPTLLISIAVLCFALFAIWEYTPFPVWLNILLSGALITLFLLIVSFFREPLKTVIPNDENILSPADGKVVVIEKVVENEYFKDERQQISIFMSPLNVHVNYHPVNGSIKFFKYHAGKYLVAWHPKSSEENERTTIVVEHPKHGEILVRQIAGAVARRICSYCPPGNKVEQGSQLGFIKFGSRLDVFLPIDAQVQVSLNDKVVGAGTVLAKF